MPATPHPSHQQATVAVVRFAFYPSDEQVTLLEAWAEEHGSYDAYNLHLLNDGFVVECNYDPEIPGDHPDNPAVWALRLADEALDRLGFAPTGTSSFLLAGARPYRVVYA
jgi:hypothetical protein